MYKEKTIPSLNFSDTTGDWLALNTDLMLRVREFETSQAALL